MSETDITKPDPLPDVLDGVYPFECASCGHQQFMQPSIMMIQFGMNTGHGICLHCRASLHLEIKGEICVSHIMNDWVKAAKEWTKDEH